MTDAIEKKPEETSALAEAEEKLEEEFEIEDGQDLEEFLGQCLGPPKSDIGSYQPTKFDARRQRVFIEEFIKTGVQAEARRCAGVTQRSIEFAKEKSPQFALVFEEARELAVGRMEKEAHRRAVEGYQRPVFQKGEQVGMETVYSDGLLKYILRANKPEKYGKGNDEQGGVHVEINMNAPETYDEKEIEADRVD